MMHWAIVLALVAAATAPAQSYKCGSYISSDCQSEYNNGVRNRNLKGFYRRCATEGGAQPLRKRCSLCCKEDEPEAPAPAPAPAKAPSPSQSNQCGSIISSDCQSEYDNAIRNGNMGHFNRRCAEGGAQPLRKRCSLCCKEDEPEAPAPAKAPSPSQSLQCGNTISSDCQSEYDNAIRNGNMGHFNRRCAEGGAQPLRKRCSLCCKEDEPEAPAPAPAKPPAPSQSYQCGSIISSDCQSEYDNAIRNGNMGHFYNRCAEGGAQPLRKRCSLCCEDDEPEPTSALPPTTDYVDVTTPETTTEHGTTCDTTDGDFTGTTEDPLVITASRTTPEPPTVDDTPCDSLASPVLSKCQGCPPMFNGKPCASTTRYNDLTKGVCGCGSDPNPLTFWTKTRYTAAGNAAMMDDMDPTNSWCTKNCGLCFEVCTTGGSHTGASHNPGECIVVQIENRCGDGYGQQDNHYCGQNMAPWDCVDMPEICKELVGYNSMNKYGYPAHFDLQDANKQITAKGWDNPEVTWELVDCSKGDFGDWEKDCQCPKATEP